MKKINILILVLFIIPFLSAFGQDNRSIYLDNADYRINGRFVDCGSPTFVNTTTDKMTISVWVKETQIQGQSAHEGTNQWANVVSYASYNSADNGIFWLQHISNNSRFEFALKNSSGTRNYITSTTNPSVNNWYYLTAVYDNTVNPTTKFYVNGILERSDNTITGNLNSFISEYKLNIGRIPASYRFFIGNIDDLRIYWGTALTQAELREQMFKSTSVVSSNLVAFYKFNSTTGIIVTDEMGNAGGTYYSGLVDVHGTVTGGDLGFNRTTYEIADDDKVWTSNIWATKTLVIMGGQGYGNCTDQLINSNTEDKLILNGWINSNATYDPKIDNPVGVNGLTWFGIKDVTSVLHWSTSTPPVTDNSSYITSSSAISAGPVGGKITMTITNGSTSHAAIIYQLGSISGSPVTTETFPGIYVTKRSNIYWGYHTWGTPTGLFVIDFSNVEGTSSSVKLLRRTRDGAWEDFTSNASLVHNIGGVKTFTVSILANGSYEFALGENNNNPLPVELTSFTSSLIGNTVSLKWSTGSEINNHGFEIQRFENDKWISVGFVQGKGTFSIPSFYHFTDRNLKTGVYKYRLKQIDLNGNFSHFNLLNDVNISIPLKFNLTQNYPNPFNPVTKIDYQLPAECRVSVKIYDLTGREVMTLFSGSAQAGYHTLTFDGSKLASGIYIYKINAEGSGTAFSKIMKLSLIK